MIFLKCEEPTNGISGEMGALNMVLSLICYKCGTYSPDDLWVHCWFVFSGNMWANGCIYGKMGCPSWSIY